MGRFLVIVLDGFGIGAMPDVPRVRPADVGANTFLRIAERFPDLYLPTLQRLGLMNAAGFETARMQYAEGVTVGRAELTHFWADTFWGHQEILGTRPLMPAQEPLSPYLEQVEAALKAAGFPVAYHHGQTGRFLVVAGAVTVADNIECDPGLAVNVTAALDHIPFADVVRIGQVVRSVVTASRVIAFGGSGVDLAQILAATTEPTPGYIGVSAPGSGVYERNYHCVHLGYGVSPETQLPHVLHAVSIPSYLFGKAADILHNPVEENSFSIVPTPEVFDRTLEVMARTDTAFFCANVQETDLCGHRENTAEYLRILQQADEGIARVLAAMRPDDLLVVMADHGNDPEIGHPQHTRERVPLLLHGAGLRPCDIGVRPTLSDVAATAAEFFGASPVQNGESFLSLIKKEQDR